MIPFGPGVFLGCKLSMTCVTSSLVISLSSVMYISCFVCFRIVLCRLCLLCGYPPESVGPVLVGEFLSWLLFLFRPVFVVLLSFVYFVFYCWLVCRPRHKGCLGV